MALVDRDIRQSALGTFVRESISECAIGVSGHENADVPERVRRVNPNARQIIERLCREDMFRTS